MHTFDEIAAEAITLFRIRYPASTAKAALAMSIAGRDVSVSELLPAGMARRRFWVKIAHEARVESIQMELVGGRLVRNLAAPDGAMARH